MKRLTEGADRAEICSGDFGERLPTENSDNRHRGISSANTVDISAIAPH